METGAFRELLAADVAVELGVLTAEEAGKRLARFWEAKDESLLQGLDAQDREKVEAEVTRILADAGGDAQAAMHKRGGMNRDLGASLAPKHSHELSEAGARLRAPLRAMDKKRYVGFLPIGEGGMGVVYLALDSELNRRVAFKMIRSGATDPLSDDSGPIADDMVARFMQEAVVTGGLEHPGIVPVYELGITPSGVPYYTMRLVRGERTLDNAIKEAGSIEDRLSLLEPFLKVCDAIGYAHSRGVIHRDLKPANIALGQFGEVVVLDWGLAKMHERPDLAGSRWQTRLDELRDVTDLKTLTSALGTPGYMAPEAALGQIDKIDTRADIYSLGAILHKILTGEFPFEFSTFQEYVAKLAQGVEDAPDPPGLGRICVKALAPARADRYGGAGELADAIRTWQTESAIDREVDGLLAEAASALDASEKLTGDAQLRRLDHTIAVAARVLDLREGNEQAASLRDRARELRAAAMEQREAEARGRLLKRVGVVGLLTATAATIVVAVLLNAKRNEAETARSEAESARAEAEDERNRAEDSRGRAEDLASFMLGDLHEGLVPVGRLDLLETVARKSLHYYTSLPSEDITDKEREARALVLRRIGEVLHSTGDMETAQKSNRESLRMYEALGDEYGASVALNQIGDVQQETNDLDGALKSYRESAAIRRKLDREGDLTRSLDRVGTVLMRKGERGPAKVAYDESLAIRRRLYAEEPDDKDRQNDLSHSLTKQGELAIGNLAEARKFFEEALALRRKLLAADPANAHAKSELAACLFRVAHCRHETGDREAGKKSYEEVLGIYRSLADADPQNIWYQRDLALTLERLHRYAEAIKVKRAVVARNPKNPRARHDLLTGLLNIGDTAKAKKDWVGALERYTEALGLARTLADEDPANTEWSEDVSDALYRLGDVYKGTKKPVEARKAYQESLAIAKRLAEKDPENGNWQSSHAVALERLGRYLESIEIRRKLYRKDPNNTWWRSYYVWLLGKLGDQTKRPEYYEEAVPVRRLVQKTNSDRRELAYCLYRIGYLREQKGELEVALPALREAWRIHRTAKGYEQERRWWTDAYFRVCYDAARKAAKAGDTTRALKHLKENLEWSRKHLPAARLAQHLAHARQDSDLAALHDLPEFAALFE